MKRLSPVFVALGVTILFVLVVVPRAQAQLVALDGTFEWQSPPLTGDAFSKIVRLEDGTLEIVSSHHAIRSTDNGATWKLVPRDPLSLELAAGAHFVDGRHGWALRNPYAYGTAHDSTRDVYATDDGGVTWKKRGHLPGKGFYRTLEFADLNTGYAAGEQGAMARTTDGGATWNSIKPVTSGFIMWGSMTVVSPNRVFLAIPYDHTSDEPVGGLFRTTDGGSTWDTLDFVESPESNMPKAHVNVVVFPVEMTGYAFTDQGQVYRTSDGGTTWEHKPTGLVGKIIDPFTGDAREPVASSAIFVDAEHGWMMTEFDEIYATADGAASWHMQDTGSAPIYVKSNYGVDGRVLITRPVFSDALSLGNGTLILVGANGTLLRTTNGGESWTEINRGFTSEHLNAVKFVNPSAGWVGGANGTLFRSEDGGAGWQRQQSGTQEDIVDIAAFDRERAWALLAQGVLRTTNGGADWQLVSIPDFPTQNIVYKELGYDKTVEHGARAMSFPTASSGWIVGAAGAIYRTTDGGLTWSRTASPEPNTPLLNGVRFIDEQRGWVAGNDGVVYRTSNGGETWSQVNPGGATGGFSGVWFTDADRGVVVGEHGAAFATTNGGAEWLLGATGTATAWEDGGFLRVEGTGSGVAWAIGTQELYGGGGFVSRSTDGGLQWSQPLMLTVPAIGNLHGLSFPTPDHGWFVGERGTVIKYTALDASSVRPSTPTGHRAAVRIFPNPARDKFVVEIPGGLNRGARLGLFNSRGEQVRGMVEPVATGEGLSTVSIDGAGLPEGVYFVRSTGEGATITCPLVLVK